ncbi:hypothetical protein [Microlunatus sp. GCM10028923]|uniref:hypothetical protein n=1 Tax=Microlunatus sp. GCM10028923 TaxID=3273400 RepID=UPI0036186B91
MKVTHLVRAAIAASALALVAGCSGPAPGQDPGADPTSRPLDAYLNPPVDKDKSKADQQAYQEALARCMKGQGFDYTPVPPQDPIEPPKIDLTDRGWVEKYGYGITTRDEGPIIMPDDPNQKRLDGMSKKQREAYQKALYGKGGGMAVTRGGGGGIPMNTGGGDTGCSGTAQKEVFPNSKPVDFQEFQDLFEAIGKLDQQVAADSRVAPLITEWAGCLAGAGYSGFAKINDAQDSIMKKWADLNGWKYEGGDRGGVSMGFPGSSEGKGPDPEKAAKLRAEEIKLALADVGCRGDYPKTSETVRRELEQRFIEEHRSELERYRDTMNQGG